MRYPQTAAIVRSARLRKGISQEEGARRVGCTRLQWINWEAGRHRPEKYVGALVSEIGIDEEALSAADPDESEAALRGTPLGAGVSLLETLYGEIGRALGKVPERLFSEDGSVVPVLVVWVVAFLIAATGWTAA